jgi:hypothetical protein
MLALQASWASGVTAAEIIPADRLADWTPGITVGVPGGIPTDRTHLIDVTKAPYNADSTGAADAQPAIKKAIADAKDNDVYKDNGVPESESLGGVQLPKSLYLREKPGWFGDLNWPPFGPDTDFEKNKIPAQVRFEAMTR